MNKWDELKATRNQLVARHEQCDVNSDDGRFEAEALEAEIEEIGRRLDELKIDWLTAMAVALEKRTKQE